MERLGSDFTSERYDLTRLGIPLDSIRHRLDYDFDRLEAVEKKLEGIDRTRVLRAIFARLTDGLATHKEKHVALLRFLHRASFHTNLRPLHRGSIAVHDPLIILELNEMHCSHASRLAVDFWLAAGYRARCIRFGAHISAEVHYDEDWHFFGPDSSGGNGIVLTDDDGSIPSWKELSLNSSRIDELPHRYELPHHGFPRTGGTPARSINCFYETKGKKVYYYTKVGRIVFRDRHYGWWTHRAREEHDWKIQPDREWQYQPGAVVFSHIEVIEKGTGGIRFRLEWLPASDKNGDVIGYRLYLSHESRGWNYGGFTGKGNTRECWSSDLGWDPAMYDALYSMPPRDAGFVESSKTEAELVLKPGQQLFVTAMAFDEYHDSVGKEMYLQSNELKIDATRLLAILEHK